MWQKLFFIPKGTALKGKNLLPVRANSSLLEKFNYEKGHN